MKLAIMLYGTRVSPRFGYSRGVMIVELSGQEEIHRRNLGVETCPPEQVPELLLKEGVAVVISGGMNHHFQNLFQSRGIQVIWGIIGEADDVLAAYKSGKLIPGMGCCLRGQKRRRFHGGEFPA
jgi:predicted Fe-Mo cluster-binding NifX family protein